MSAKVQQLALVDCNNFYCSCERVFRPDLKTTPLVVLSNNDGCAVSRSAEAKALGIKMGVPWFQVKDFAEEHGVLAFSSNYALYADMSNRVMSILSAYSPRTEVYSIDECFVDLTGIQKLRDVTYGMRERVGQWTGIPVCVGVGATKTLAKMANHIAKTHPRSKGVFNFNDLTVEQQEKLLKRIPVDEVWGVGRRLSKRLVTHEVSTAYDLKVANTSALRADFGVVMERTQRELQGISCIELEDAPSPKKQMLRSRSFGKPVVDLHVMQDALSVFTTSAVQALREQNSTTSFIQVFMSTSRYRANQPQYNPSMCVPLPQATNDTQVVLRWVAHVTERLWKDGFAYAKAGVMLGELAPESNQQFDLLEPRNGSNSNLMKAIDSLNNRFGKGCVRVSTGGLFDQWGMKQERKSHAFTTSWSDIPVV
jgi:DNA polymerase V